MRKELVDFVGFVISHRRDFPFAEHDHLPCFLEIRIRYAFVNILNRDIHLHISTWPLHKPYMLFVL